MRVLITGANGFTGRHLARGLIANGYEAIGLSAHKPVSGSTLGDGMPHEAFPVANCDLNDAEALAYIVQQVQPTHVVHLAAVSFVAHGQRADFYRTNVLGTLNLLEALAALPTRPQKILLPSSANVYGQCDVPAIDEDQPPAPASDYAVSKIAMELAARLWFERLPIIIVRPFNYTGLGQSDNFLVPKIVAHYREARPVLELGNLDVARDFSDVRWVTEVYLRLLESPHCALTCNICSGSVWSLRDILDICSALTGHRPQIKVNPAFVRSNELARLCGNPARLRAALPDLPAPVRLPDTLAWMLGRAP